jgi:hypothetical protein
VEYATGDREYYDLRTDPHELNNTITALPQARLVQLQHTLQALRACQGTAACSAAARLPEPGSTGRYLMRMP